VTTNESYYLNFDISNYNFQTLIEHKQSKRALKEHHKHEVFKTTSNFSFVHEGGKKIIKRTTPVKEGFFRMSKSPKVIDLEDDDNSRCASRFNIPTENINLECVKNDEPKPATEKQNIIQRFKKKIQMKSNPVNISINISSNISSPSKTKRYKRQYLSWKNTRKALYKRLY
jgi:hypothetical protein